MDEELLDLCEPEEPKFVDGDDGMGEENDAVDENITREDIWAVISSFFRSKGLVHQQLDSYNYFLARIPMMLQNLADVIPRKERQFLPGENDVQPKQMRARFVGFQLGTPWHSSNPHAPLYPNEARLRDLTYAATSRVNVEISLYDPQHPDEASDVMTFEEELGRIPIMLGSMRCNLADKDADEKPVLNECSHDQGGYFVINGTEKVIIAQERQAANHVYAFTRPKGVVCEVKSMIEGQMLKPRTFVIVLPFRKKGPVGGGFENLQCRIAQMDELIPLFVLFRALDMKSDREILQTIVPDLSDGRMLELLRGSMEEVASGLAIFSKEDALYYIGKRLAVVDTRERLIEMAQDLLNRELLPHMGMDPTSERKKCFFAGYMVHRLLLLALGRREDTDRDFLGHKRIDNAGALLGYQFSQILLQIRRYIQQRLTNAGDGKMIMRPFINSRLVTDGLRSCLATGNFGDRKTGIATGVSQTLNRLTYSSTLSNLRRVQNPIDPSSKVTRPRNLHCTHWGYICPVETPEGGSIGLLKNLALMCLVSMGSDHTKLVQLVQACGVKDLTMVHPADMADVKLARVFVNGTLLGIHSDPAALLRRLRHYRSNGNISNETSIVRDIRDREIRLYSDQGRPIRPLFVVEQRRLKLGASGMALLRSLGHGAIRWTDVLIRGYVELIDNEEEDSILIAMTVNAVADNYYYSHCEMDPAMILGVCASIIPFPNYNQSPRNTYQSAMGKQAMGIYATNFNVRIDTTAHVLFYPQKPLVVTKTMEYMHSNDLPAGHNAIVAIACYSGYNQEDSVVMCRSAVERGFFRSLFWRSYKTAAEQDLRKGVESLERPDNATERRRPDYNSIDADGLAKPGVCLAGGEVVIGKTTAIPEEERQQLGIAATKRDSSVCCRLTERGVVDTVMLSENGDGNRFTKVKVRTVKIPNIGDKFCSRHGQKGTNGIQFRQEDMPFTRDGIVPDIIMNPHAIPSRMTVAHLVETLAGKVGCITAAETEATAFSTRTGEGTRSRLVEELASSLHSLGFQRYGNERLYNGHTGLPLEYLIFFGPTYYQRLKHLSADKIHARPTGPLQNLVRQPTEGRAHNGGLRFGEMERDCMLSYGASQWLRERLFRVSDLYAVHVCDLCGTFCAANTNTHAYFCSGCDNDTEISRVMMPYACKLLIQELMSMTILPRLVTGPQ